MKTGAYIVQATRGEPCLLCVMDPDRGFFSFEISVPVMARLAAECSDRVNVALGGVDFVAAGEESAKLLSKLQQERGLPSGP